MKYEPVFRGYISSKTEVPTCTPDIAFTKVDFPWATCPIVPVKVETHNNPELISLTASLPKKQNIKINKI